MYTSKWRQFIHLVCFLVIYTVSISEAYAQGDVLKKEFIPLSDQIFENNDALHELDSLLLSAAKSKIIAVGEATHGSQEVLDLQILVAKKLIENYNLRAIILGESRLLRSYKIYDWTINENEDRKDDVIEEFAGLKDFLLWVREFSKNNSTKVLILGADIDDPEEVLGFINEHFRYSDNYTAVHENLKYIHRFLGKDNVTAEESGNVNLSFEAVKSALAEQRGASDSLDFKIDIMMFSLENLINSFWIKDNEARYLKRDKAIFDIIQWAERSLAHEKILILKAHNYHVNKQQLLPEVFKGNLTLGELLAEKYREDYNAIGTEIFTGDFSSGERGEKLAIKQDKNKLGNRIAKRFPSVKFGMITSEGNTRKFLNGEKIMLTMGTAGSKVISGKGKAGDAFNTIFYISDSTPYKYFKETSAFNLVSSIDSNVLQSKLKGEKIKWQVKYESQRGNVRSQVVFYNAFNYPITSMPEHAVCSDKEFAYEIPEGCSKIVLWLTVKDAELFELQSVKVNGISLPPKDIKLYDYHSLGVKRVETENNKILFSLE